jgi:hypothetical protein
MGKHPRTVSEILAGHEDAPYDPEHREFIEQIASALYERHEDFPRWPEKVQFFYACYDLNFQVGNGGFAQAAYNVPQLIPVAQKAFEYFGRAEAALLCREALSRLPAELAEHLAKGFTGSESLEDVFEHFSESDMADLDERITMDFWADDQLHDLVQKNRKDFESVDAIGSRESKG